VVVVPSSVVDEVSPVEELEEVSVSSPSVSDEVDDVEPELVLGSVADVARGSSEAGHPKTRRDRSVTRWSCGVTM